jgi:hypothetical protein
VYRRVISRIAPDEIERCFMNWVRAVKRESEREAADVKSDAIDGKAPHIVSVGATENRPVFGQAKTEEKSKGNEVYTITAIPALLEKLAPEGCIVTIDDMGCQYKIADQVAGKKADYLFSLKGSRGTLQEDVKEYFADPGFSAPSGANRHIPFQPVPAHDERHGRREDRDYAVSDDVGWLIERHPDWKTIRSIGVVEPGREVRGRRRWNGVFLCPAWRRTRNSLPGRFAGIGG